MSRTHRRVQPTLDVDLTLIFLWMPQTLSMWSIIKFMWPPSNHISDSSPPSTDKFSLLWHPCRPPHPVAGLFTHTYPLLQITWKVWEMGYHQVTAAKHFKVELFNILTTLYAKITVPVHVCSCTQHQAYAVLSACIARFLCQILLQSTFLVRWELGFVISSALRQTSAEVWAWFFLRNVPKCANMRHEGSRGEIVF